MRNAKQRLSWTAGALGLVAGSAVSVARIPAEVSADAVHDRTAYDALKAAAPGTRFLELGGDLKRVYGPNLASGATPAGAAEAFLKTYSTLFGVDFGDLSPWSMAGDGANVLPLMPEDDGSMRFNLVTYTQRFQGLPVFRGDVRVLARNTPENDVVWVGNALRPMTDVVLDQAVLAAPKVQEAVSDAELRFPEIVGGEITPPELVVWAGLPDQPAKPRLALQFLARTAARSGEPGYGSWIIIADAATGRMLWSESQIFHADVTGRVSGMATTGIKTAECNPEADAALPYTRVVSGAVTGFADANGNYTLTGVPAGTVSVSAGPRGRYFRTYGPSAEMPAVSSSGAGTVNVQLNAANTDETTRASVNAYLNANVVRDMVIAASPSYPRIATQSEFPIRVNIADTCNAYYDPQEVSINFFAAGGGCGNTAFYDVVHHEFGHHVVQAGGSGQGQYGEGTGDCMGVLISDQPMLGVGFQGNCNAGIRNANNTRQYPQDPNTIAIHTAGQLISGCVWSTRNAMVTAGVANYRTLMQRLCVNAVPMHSGSTIAPDITVDWLTLDDTDGNINNGTPHYAQINAGFTAHNMDGPQLQMIDFAFPDGLPTVLVPGRATSIRVNVVPVIGTPQDNTGRFSYRVGAGADVALAMTRTGANQYTATIPAQTCGGTVTYSFSARATDGTVQLSPAGAPAVGNTVVVSYGTPLRFSDNFETNRGWTVTNSGGLTDGPWSRGVPVRETGDRAAAVPTGDYDGSGSCFLTDNVAGNSDVDGGSTVLTSPAMDASGGPAVVSYARWYSNNTGSSPEADVFTAEVSGDNGATWSTLETVGPSGVEVRGGWFFKTFAVPAAAATAQFKIRFTASDPGTGSVVEAAVDAVSLTVFDCDAPSCPADFNGDGFQDFFDYDDFVNCFETGNCPAGRTADFNSDDFIDFFDYDDFVSAFESGC